MRLFSVCLIALIMSSMSVSWAYEEISGLKFPNDANEGTEPVLSYAMLPKKGQRLTGFTDLLPYVLASPDQEDGGSCLYMSLTGNLEWWLARNAGKKYPLSDGPYDLSERYLMNASKVYPTPRSQNWKTDKVYLLKSLNGVALNKNYRYTKGYYLKDPKYRSASPQDQHARYGTKYNWVNVFRDYNGPLTKLPKLGRKILAAPAGTSKWSVGVMPKDIVAKTKAALRNNSAPVLAMYNHFGYWHVSMIVGYTDDESSGNCHFTRQFPLYMKKKALKALDQANMSTDQAKIKRLRWKATNWTNQADSVQQHLDQVGCAQKGMFYVRDSIYSMKGQPLYDYDPSKVGEETPYSVKIVMRDYAWLESMANHVFQILPE